MDDEGRNQSIPLDCPVFDSENDQFIARWAFWTDGVIKTILAILGIIGNIGAIRVLTRVSMRNSFNLLLVTMAILDSTYLTGAILESIRKRFHLESDLLVVLFPYFLYPLNYIALTASIFMTVAIALERYIAVHYPIDYNMATNDLGAMQKRLLRYVLPVMLLAIGFNVTKFLESEVAYKRISSPVEGNFTTETIPPNMIEYHEKPYLQVTDLRTNPLFSAYSNWSRLFVLGIIPFNLLVFFNWNIFKDVRARKMRRINQRVPHAPVRETTVLTLRQNHPNDNDGASHVLPRQPKLPGASKPAEAVKALVAPTGTRSQSPEDPDPNSDPLASEVERSDVEAPFAVRMEVIQAAATTLPPKTKNRPFGKKTSKQNERRRRVEDNLAIVFMGFILVFLCCHAPRICLDIHELFTLKQANACRAQGFRGFPAWSLIAIHISHVLLVLNSATNILIYCSLSSKFREEFKAVCGRRK